MSYVINKFNGEQLVVLQDGTLDTTTSLNLVGRNYVGYGESQNENFVWLLEHFAKDSAPVRPLKGQIWFNTLENTSYVYDGDQWNRIGSATIGGISPTNPTSGSLWLKTPINTLNVYTGTDWQQIGPESVEGFGSTRARSASLDDTLGNPRPVVFLETNGSPIAICSSEEFTIHPDFIVANFDSVLKVGINLSNLSKVYGDVEGTAIAANQLSQAKLINGIPFNGTSNVTIKASTTNYLRKGTHVIGSDFDGSSEITWSVDATSNNTVGKIVVRDSAGDFSARTVTANLVGNVTGNVTATTGTSVFDVVQANSFVGATLSGTANAARQLANSPQINGVTFTGLNDVTVTAAADTLTSNTLAPNVIYSSLSQVGTLTEVNVGDIGVKIGSGATFNLLVDSAIPVIQSTTGNLNIDCGANAPFIRFVNTSTAVSLGGPATPAITGNNNCNIGLPTSKFTNVYASNYKGIDIEVSSITAAGPGTSITANGDFIITGNLTIQGSTTTISSSELSIADKLINLAVGSLTASAANGSGIYVDGANASLIYSSSGNKWVMNKLLDMGANNVLTTGQFQGTATSALYADLAERYTADDNYLPGTVLEIGGQYEVTLAQDESTKIAGVVSTDPAYLMNANCNGEHVIAVALLGKVPCKVIGPIKKGDFLVSAGNGYAKSKISPTIGSIIGKSLEDFDGYDGIIQILVGRI